jgi:hypothetical protein
MPSVVSSVEVTVEFEAWCDECGAGICHLVSSGYSDVNITPCEKCIAAALDEGEDKGHASRDDEVEKLEYRVDELETDLDEVRAGHEVEIEALEAEVKRAREEGWSKGFCDAKEAA